eukprot:1187218-Prorocentrum_minimum.AAC.2
MEEGLVVPLVLQQPLLILLHSYTTTPKCIQGPLPTRRAPWRRVWCPTPAAAAPPYVILFLHDYTGVYTRPPHPTRAMEEGLLVPLLLQQPLLLLLLHSYITTLECIQGPPHPPDARHGGGSGVPLLL